MLGFIPLQLTGTTVARYIQANIFDKLKMTSSTFNVQKADQTGKLAKGIGKDGLTPNDPFGVNATSREIPNFNPDSGDDGNGAFHAPISVNLLAYSLASRFWSWWNHQ